MKEWSFKDYNVYEEECVLRFEDKTGNVLGKVIKNDDSAVKDLDNGADPLKERWEDGVGNTVTLEGW